MKVQGVEIPADGIENGLKVCRKRASFTAGHLAEVIAVYLTSTPRALRRVIASKAASRVLAAEKKAGRVITSDGAARSHWLRFKPEALQ